MAYRQDETLGDVGASAFGWIIGILIIIAIIVAIIIFISFVIGIIATAVGGGCAIYNYGKSFRDNFIHSIKPKEAGS